MIYSPVFFIVFWLTCNLLTFLFAEHCNMKHTKLSYLLLIQTYPEHYLVAFKMPLWILIFRKHTFLKRSAAFFLQIWKNARYLPEPLWRICFGLRFDDMLRIISCSSHHQQKKTVESFHFRRVLTVALQRHSGNRIMVSNNPSYSKYLIQLWTGCNSLIFIFSECNTSLN